MPKKVDHDQRRRAIAAAAVTAIAAQGLEDVKLTQIARLAGVTTGAVTHYFDSKDDVLLAALELICERLFERADAVAMAPADEPLLAIYDALPTDPQALAEWKVWLAFWGRAAFVPHLAAVHRAYYQRIEDSMMVALGRDVEIARLRASAIIAAIDGIGTRVALEPNAWPPDRLRALLSMILLPLLSSFEHEEKSHDSKPADSHAPAA
jgi:TetR/AcrR family transcriptional regulator, transcriptional repressor of bet genes